jgi:hypothetical protein
MDEYGVPCREPDCPVIYVTAFFHSEKVSQFFIGSGYVLRLGFYGYRFSGHYLKEKGYRTVGPTADPEACGNFKAFQFFKEICFQNDTSR